MDGEVVSDNLSAEEARKQQDEYFKQLDAQVHKTATVLRAEARAKVSSREGGLGGAWGGEGVCGTLVDGWVLAFEGG
jgi:hypothetical protein